ncbi:hypothetical protein AB0M39_25055 [Streptomyces sp. NPDC051907]|uniref:hypothetical protein n=1 Tax=Streptomyces sp. NPDC051907 TaxID=3155284 RepID=UPI00342D7F79
MAHDASDDLDRDSVVRQERHKARAQHPRPYRRHQYATASLIKVDVTTLWEDSRTVESSSDLSKAEIVTVYPHRHMVPGEL